MSEQIIRKLLETKLDTITPALDTVRENGKAYTPVSGRPYQQVYVIGADPSNPELNGPFVEFRGYMQVNLRYPSGQGTGPVDARVDLIRNTFPFCLSMGEDGITVTVNRTPTRSPGYEDGDRYVVPVKIFFKANNS